MTGLDGRGPTNQASPGVGWATAIHTTPSQMPLMLESLEEVRIYTCKNYKYEYKGMVHASTLLFIWRYYLMHVHILLHRVLSSVQWWSSSGYVYKDMMCCT